MTSQSAIFERRVNLIAPEEASLKSILIRYIFKKVEIPTPYRWNSVRVSGCTNDSPPQPSLLSVSKHILSIITYLINIFPDTVHFSPCDTEILSDDTGEEREKQS